MGRRIKEEPIVHRERIATAASELFKEHGTTKVTVNDIAKKAGYSKATLYTYFENKDEIVSYLALKSMSLLKDEIIKNTDESKTDKENFLGICKGLLKYYQKYPMYFDFAQDTINVDFSENKFYNTDLDTYIVGQEISAYIKKLFKLGDEAFITTFAMWGSLCGVIKLAANKEAFIKKETSKSKEAFLSDVFNILYKVV